MERQRHRQAVIPGATRASPVILCSAGAATSMASQQQASGQTRLSYTSYECNAWELKLAKSGVTVLIDPWLVGSLTFAEQAWLFRGEKGAKHVQIDVDAIADRIDFILLSQGLPDHAHPPTLKRLPKNIPVVGSPTACRVASELGFKQVYELEHGKEISMCNGRLNVRAFAGALVGPPWSTRENGYLITETVEHGIRLFYEPHCDVPDSALQSLPPIDVVVTATSSQSLLGYELVQGDSSIEKVVRQTRPRVLVPLINAAFKLEGPLAKLIYERGSPKELKSRLQKAGLGSIDVQLAEPGQPLEVAW
ncbi:hypothetical protein WJX72_005598 [[Myrmecia] bisecta]|uniref:MBL fold metallo-hydrolase n=1 Tax=[Myrmecia] bisecta TaxID=41462 RepID=A0AAW1QF70_9CHLO